MPQHCASTIPHPGFNAFPLYGFDVRWLFNEDNGGRSRNIVDWLMSDSDTVGYQINDLGFKRSRATSMVLSKKHACDVVNAQC